MHTKLPWKVVGDVDGEDGIEIRESSSENFIIADIRWSPGYDDAGGDATEKDNAELIVRAVNNHESLISALEKIIEMNVQYCIDKYGDASKADSMGCVVTAREALAKAKS